MCMNVLYNVSIIYIYIYVSYLLSTNYIQLYTRYNMVEIGGDSLSRKIYRLYVQNALHLITHGKNPLLVAKSQGQLCLDDSSTQSMDERRGDFEGCGQCWLLWVNYQLWLCGKAGCFLWAHCGWQVLDGGVCTFGMSTKYLGGLGVDWLRYLNDNQKAGRSLTSAEQSMQALPISIKYHMNEQLWLIRVV